MENFKDLDFEEIFDRANLHDLGMMNAGVGDNDKGTLWEITCDLMSRSELLDTDGLAAELGRLVSDKNHNMDELLYVVDTISRRLRKAHDILVMEG